MQQIKNFPHTILLICCFWILNTNLIKAYSYTAEMIDACVEQEGVTVEEIRKITPTTNINEKLQCYVKCVLIKGGYVDGAGNINMKIIKSDSDDIKDAATREKVFKCLEGVKKVVVCKDVEPVRACYNIGE